MLLQFNKQILARLLYRDAIGTNMIQHHSFVVTGGFENYKNRQKIFDMIQDLGGTVHDKIIPGSTDYLVHTNERKLKDAKSGKPTTKLREAKKHRVQILDERTMEQWLSIHPDSNFNSLHKL